LLSAILRPKEVAVRNTAAPEELIAELEEDGESFYSSGFWNNIIDLSLTVLTVLASLVATVLATTEAKDVSRWIVAAVAAIPAGATSLQRIVGIRDRSNWYFSYAAQVRALATKLKYADAPTVQDFANKRAEIEEAMEGEWSKIGHSGATSAGRVTGRSARRGKD
jgi:hypothetical protein